MEHRLIISAPFGNYLNFRGAMHTLGTYTLQKRAGFLRRWWRVVRTVRYARGTWVSQLGLPSPGIQSLNRPLGADDILSMHGFSDNDWGRLAQTASFKVPRVIELNLSCPNVAGLSMGDVIAAYCLVRRVYGADLRIIAKVGPIDVDRVVTTLYHEAGCRDFHLCNASPSEYGSVSGKALKPYAIRAVEAARRFSPKETRIIGGGGVTGLQDVKDYLSAGADDVAIASMLFNPLNWRKVPTFVEYLKGQSA